MRHATQPGGLLQLAPPDYLADERLSVEHRCNNMAAELVVSETPWTTCVLVRLLDRMLDLDTVVAGPSHSRRCDGCRSVLTATTSATRQSLIESGEPAVNVFST